MRDEYCLKEAVSTPVLTVTDALENAVRQSDALAVISERIDMALFGAKNMDAKDAMRETISVQEKIDALDYYLRKTMDTLERIYGRL